MSAMANFWPKVPAPAATGQGVDSLNTATPMSGDSQAPAEVRKKYVNIPPIFIKVSFDDKYKSSLPPGLNAAFAKAVNGSAKLTTEPPADNAEGFNLDGSVSLKKTATGIDASMSMAMASWPGKSIFGTASNESSLPLDNPEMASDDDVDFLLAALVEDVTARVLKELEKRAK